MSFISKKTVTIDNTTATLTGAYGYTSACNGSIRAIKYTKSTSASFSTGAALSVYSYVNSVSILSMPKIGAATFTKYPKGTCVNSTNGAITFYTDIPVSEEKIVIRVGSTSAASTAGGQTGTFDIFVEGV